MVGPRRLVATTCSCCRKHECTGLDLVRNDRIIRPVQLLNALDADHIGARALDAGAHAVEEVGRVDNVRLLGGILNDRHTLCHDGCHHDIDGRAHRDDVHVDMGSAKHIRLGYDHSGRRKAHIRAQCPEALDVLIDRTQSDITAAGKRYRRTAVPAQKGADQIIRSSDLAHVFIVYDRVPVDS